MSVLPQMIIVTHDSELENAADSIIKVKKENGMITEVIRYTPGEGEWKPYEKYVFEYNDTEISPSRYASMINYFIANHGGNYYYYNWY
jgi:hypothetical protein